MEFVQYFINHQTQIIKLLIEHIQLTSIAVFFACIIGIPTGILVSYSKKLKKPVMGLANLVQAIPSMALLGFSIPLFGIGIVPSIVAVILYSLLPIIKSTYTGIDSISPKTIEAARGIGLTRLQILYKIRIPLALPIIMSGVRVAAVTAVGLMTIAAFIGAGGLGYLVFSGIRTVNTAQILAGAIPACFLALGVDSFLGIIEKLATPLNMQKQSKKLGNKTRHWQKATVALTSFCLIGLLIASAVPGKTQSSERISIGTKDFTEQLILGNMVADIIESNTDIGVERQFNLGGTQVCFTAMQSGDIDMYIEYTGTVYGDVLGYPPIGDVDKVYSVVKQDLSKQYHIAALDQMGFNNTYTLAVTQETAKKYNLKTISDFAKIASSLKSGTTLEFLNREDGLPGLKHLYKFELNDEIALDGSTRYAALNNREVDVIDAFSTDGLLKKFNLVILEDDQHFFPPYYAVPLISEAVLQKYPEVKPLLQKLGAELNNEVMMELNYQVDELQRDPAEVAHQFLQEKGLLKKI